MVVSKRHVGFFLAALFLLGSLSVFAQLPPQESVTVRRLPLPGPHWLYISSPVTGTNSVTQMTVVDGDRLEVMGQLSGGVMATFAISPDRKHLYMAETYYSRGTRGQRTDVVTIYGSQTLAVEGEILISTKRQVSVPDSSSMAITPDGRFLLISNLTPASSVSVVDVSAKKVLGEIPTLGCGEVLVYEARSFASICGDGSILSVEFTDQGHTVVEKRSPTAFFNPEKDPVFGVPAMFEQIALFVSYNGMVLPLNMATAPAQIETGWPLLTQEEKNQGWKPGGWQPLAGQRGKALLFVLMHQGGEWTQKEAGNEVWVYDIHEKKRINRIVLSQPADSILVSQDDDPRLFAESESPATLQVLSAVRGNYFGIIKDLYGIAFELYGPGL